MKTTKIKLFFLILFVAIIGCEKQELLVQETSSSNLLNTKSTTLINGLTDDFSNWLNLNGYGQFDFSRDDLDGGSFGGKLSSGQQITNNPVIFVHGNSDKALGTIFTQTGWTSSREHFANNGYSNAELYAFTWGPANAMQSANQYHSYDYINQIRAFIQAVADYTNSPKVDIICHSMGVTLARKAIKGGSGYDPAVGNYNLGNPLTDLIDTFVGIAGANQGLVSCYQVNGSTATCNNENGLYPGYLWWGFGPYGVSDILVDINSSVGYEGDYVYSIWSTADGIIGWGNLVYGKYTSRIPGQDGEKVFNYSPYGHFNVKDLTEEIQLQMVKYQFIP